MQCPSCKCEMLDMDSYWKCLVCGRTVRKKESYGLTHGRVQLSIGNGQATLIGRVASGSRLPLS